MRPLQERLSANYRTVTIDWPGFGDRPRARHDWRPEIYSDFLSYVAGTVLPPVHAVIAAEAMRRRSPFLTLAFILDHSSDSFS